MCGIWAETDSLRGIYCENVNEFLTKSIFEEPYVSVEGKWKKKEKKQAADVWWVEQQHNRPDFCESTSSGEQVQAQSTFPFIANCSLWHSLENTHTEQAFAPFLPLFSNQHITSLRFFCNVGNMRVCVYVQKHLNRGMTKKRCKATTKRQKSWHKKMQHNNRCKVTTKKETLPQTQN